MALDWKSLEKGTWMDIVHHCTILIHTVAMNSGIGLTTELWGLSWRIPSAHLKLFKTWPEICNSYWLVVSKTVFPSESTRNDNTNWRIFEASPYKFLALGCYPIICPCIVASCRRSPAENELWWGSTTFYTQHVYTMWALFAYLHVSMSPQTY